MRLLLDEAMAPGLADILTALGHPSDHISDLGMSGASDEEVVQRAMEYDALLTLDLHRQESEWVAVNNAMLSGAKVIRLRFRGSEVSSLLSQTQSIVRKWSEIERLVMDRDDVRLVVVSGEGSRVRARTADAIRATLRSRQS